LLKLLIQIQIMIRMSFIRQVCGVAAFIMGFHNLIYRLRVSNGSYRPFYKM